MKIEKKTWPEYFQKVLNGEKNFEVRLADFPCKAGDILVLREWDPQTRAYTGRVLEKEVGYVFNTQEAKFWPPAEIEEYGLYVIALKNPK